MALAWLLGATPVPAMPAADSVIVIEGRGFGHGVGMAQDGAYWLGLSGRSATDILRVFFPGAILAKKGGTVRVPLGSGANFTLAFPLGGAIGGARVPAGHTVAVTLREGEVVATLSTEAAPPVSGGATKNSVRVGAVGQRGFSVGLSSFQTTDPGVIPLTTTTTAIPPTIPPTVPPTTEPPAPEAEPTIVAPIESTPGADAPSQPEAGSASHGGAAGRNERSITKSGTASGVSVRATTLDASSSTTVGFGGRRYRGTLELSLVSGAVRVVNEIDIEDYLRGMGEILTPSWPAATLEAQAIAARTYALRYMAASGEICPTQRCQVYLGAQAEYPAMDHAVESTRSKVLVYAGKLIAAFYSASGGGTIATPAEAFGGDVEIPYLRAGAYPTGDLKAWTVTMTLGEIARRVGYRGSPSGIAITEVGASGRALTVSFYGSVGTLEIRGPSFDAALGLKSTFFTFGPGSSTEVSGSSDPVLNADPLSAAVEGRTAGPVGPRVPVIGRKLVGGTTDEPGNTADLLSAQSDILRSGDSAADFAPDDTLGFDSSDPAGGVADTPVIKATSGSVAEPVETTFGDAAAPASQPPTRQQALRRSPPSDQTGGGLATPVLGGAVVATIAVGVSGLVRKRRRRSHAN